MTNKNAQSLGKLGGLATKAKYGSDYFKKIRKLSKGRTKQSQKAK